MAFYDLRPYQLLGIDRIHRDKRTILADDMGMGKTAEAIAAKHLIEGDIGEHPTLVVAPSAVAPHWAREMKKWYYKGTATKVAPLRVTTFREDMKNIQRERKDFIIAPYSLLSRLATDPESIESVNRLGIGYAILDEGHSARNPDSLRATAAREMLHRVPFLTIATGTPIPNTLIDIYSLLNLLDRETFPLNTTDSGAVLHNFYEMIKKTPHLVRDILHNRMIRRTAEQYLEKKMPVLEQRVEEVQLNGDHEDIYLAVYENEDIPAALKLQELVKISLDPNLANPQYLPESLRNKLGRIPSSTYSRLDQIAAEVAQQGGKIAAFSDLKRGVIDTLMNRFSAYNPLAITGDVSAEERENGSSDRENIRRLFQFQPQHKMLFATNVMDEGVDLTGATHLLHLTVPYMPSTLSQRNRRSQRVSAEVEKDRVCSIILKPVLSNGAPTVNEGVMQLLDDKARIIKYIIETPEKLTMDDLELIKNGHPEESPALVGFLSEKRYVDWHLGSLKGMGGAKIKEGYEEKPYIAQNMAKAYAKHWEGYYGGNAATLSARIINELLKGTNNPRVVDIACGPYSLSRRMGITMHGLDVNPYMLEAGKILEEEGLVPKGNVGHVGLANELPFSDESFDLANCSLALHMSTLKLTDRVMPEREEIFREANRILPLGGKYVFTLPHSVIHKSNIPVFAEGLSYLGFRMLPQTGFYRGSEDNSNFRVFLGAAEKYSEPGKEPVSAGFIRWKMDDKLEKKRVGRTLSPRKNPLGKKKKEAFELVTGFVRENDGGRI